MTKENLTLAVLVAICAFTNVSYAQLNVDTSGTPSESTISPTASYKTVYWLISPSDALNYDGELGYTQPGLLSAKALVPSIEILKPESSPGTKVKAPFGIAVQFKSQPDAAIVPSTFKVLYGGLKFDITSRITKYVTVSEDGFSLDNAQIPVGKHRLILQVEDAKQRLAERELKFEVE